MLPKIDHRCLEPVTDEVGRRFRQEDLTAVTHREKTCHPVQHRTEIVALSLICFTGVKSHSNPDDHIAPIAGYQLSLSLKFDLPDQSVVVLALDAHRFEPDLTSVAGQDVYFVPGPPSRPLEGSPLAKLVVVIESSYPADCLVQVPHELGHAMFNLPDEYVGRQQLGFEGRDDLSSWPTCAERGSEADDWWGDLVGDVDPMVDLWIAQVDEAGFPPLDSDALAAGVAVSNVDGGCYAVAGSVRATFDSLMNTNIPVLGAVNRHWAEEILDLWDGAAAP